VIEDAEFEMLAERDVLSTAPLNSLLSILIS
jgi:hypothetical protein